MRAEVQFRPRPEQNRGLFAYLHVMAEISELQRPRLSRAPAPHSAAGVRIVRRAGS
jgi:hypothetical protein